MARLQVLRRGDRVLRQEPPGIALLRGTPEREAQFMHTGYHVDCLTAYAGRQ
jgi:hypothetical protein